MPAVLNSEDVSTIKELMQYMVAHSGLSGAQLSRNLGHSDNYIWSMLRNVKMPSVETFVAVASACGYTVTVEDTSPDYDGVWFLDVDSNGTLEVLPAEMNIREGGNVEPFASGGFTDAVEQALDSGNYTEFIEAAVKSLRKDLEDSLRVIAAFRELHPGDLVEHEMLGPGVVKEVHKGSIDVLFTQSGDVERLDRMSVFSQLTKASPNDSNIKDGTD